MIAVDPNRPDDALLMAYADGELDDPAHAATRAAVQQALAADPALAARVQAQQALRQRLQAAFASDLDEAVPPRLLAALQPAQPLPSAAVPVPVPGQAGRVGRATPAANPAWRWAGMAATVVMALLLGVQMGVQTGMQTGEPAGEQAGVSAGLPGAGPAAGPALAEAWVPAPLARALDTQLAAEPGAVTVVLSFVDEQGRVCRAFDGAGHAGLACRDSGLWRLQLLVPAAGDAAASAVGTGLRQAASALPPAVLAEVDRRAVQGTLDAAAEAAARQRGWQGSAPAGPAGALR